VPVQGGWGLGIKRLDTQNACLLLKLVHRLHHPEGSAWATWANTHIRLDSLQGGVSGTHWDGIRELLPAYIVITRVDVGDGADTSFWDDVWMEDGTLAERFPALHSHSTEQGVSVREALSTTLPSLFQRRMSRQAQAELQQLEMMLSNVSLSTERDQRSCFFAGEGHKLISGLIYRACTRTGSTCPDYQFVWKNIATPRVKFFGWLLTRNRINCKSNLLNKGVLEDDTCVICGQEPETADHIISGCSFAKEFWRQIGWPPGSVAEVHCLWESTSPVPMPRMAHASLLLLLSWELWKHRHDVVFRAMQPSHPRLISACRETARQWRCRLPRNDDRLFSFWCNHLPM
jgi:hypothetical protein